jgi:thioredoxin 1
MSIVEVTEVSFDSEVVQSELPTLVDFWAPWCAPCVALTPTIEAISEMYAGRVKVVKVNIDEARPLADRYGVRGIPHLVFLKQGKEIGVVRSHTRTRMTLELDRLIA